MATVKVRVDNRDHLEELFNFVNSHVTLYERATLVYEQEPKSSDPQLQIPKDKLQPIRKTPEEYLEKFLPPVQLVTTRMIGKTCAICFESLMPGEKYRQLNCRHSYHQCCIDRWMSNNFDDLMCPLCRRTQYKDSVLE